MSLYILDTSAITDFFHGDPVLVRNVYYHTTDEIVTTVITYEEQIAGWLSVIRQAKTPERMELGYRRLAEAIPELGKWKALPYTVAAFNRFTALLKMHLNVDGNDLRIAAIALEADATVVMQNVQDFKRVPGLRYEDWSKEL